MENKQANKQMQLGLSVGFFPQNFMLQDLKFNIRLRYDQVCTVPIWNICRKAHVLQRHTMPLSCFRMAHACFRTARNICTNRFTQSPIPHYIGLLNSSPLASPLGGFCVAPSSFWCGYGLSELFATAFFFLLLIYCIFLFFFFFFFFFLYDVVRPLGCDFMVIYNIIPVYLWTWKLNPRYV